MAKIDSTQDRQYPEQVDKNLMATHQKEDFRFPARASLSMLHLLARANAEDYRNFECIVIGLNKETGQRFISTTLPPLLGSELMGIMSIELAAGVALGHGVHNLNDADPDSSPHGD